MMALLILAPSSAVFFPRPAHALFGVGDIVLDPTNLIQTTFTAIAAGGLNTKEYILDTAVTLAAKATMAAIQRSTLNWINSGFQGSPAFVTNIRENLLRVGDAVAANFFDELASGIIDSPYQDEIATAVRTGYYLSTGGQFSIRNPFTLNQYSSDPDAFLRGEFDQGGLDAWFSVVTQQQNNPYGAYQLALGELDQRLSSAEGRRITELNWGNGYRSLRDCELQGGGSGGSVSLSEKDNCLESPITLLGTNIADQVNHTLGYPQDALVSADEINELLGALFTQLVSKVMGPGGLIGVSQPSSGGGRGYLDQINQPQPVQQPSGTTASTVTRTDLLAYISNWGLLETAAENALDRCPSSKIAANALTDSTTAITKGNVALEYYDQAGPDSVAYSTIAPSEAEIAEIESIINDSDGLYAELRVNAVVCTGN